MAKEVTFGLPSQHSQGAVVFWGMLACLIRKWWVVIIAVLLPCIIGFSRVYLGVHFPTDVFAGWAVGLLLIVGFIVFGKTIEDWIAPQPVRVKVILFAIIALLMNALNPKETAISGMFFGMAIGATYMFEYIKFSAKGTTVQKILRYGIGMIVTLVLYFGIKYIAPQKGFENYELFRFIRYVLLSGWVVIGAPYLFVTMKIAGTEAPGEKAVDTIA
jgi:hypothetical protein